MFVKFIIITLSLLNSIVLIGQSSKEQNICINLRTEKFIIGLDNPIDISYPQLKPIQLKDISAEFKHYKTKEKRKLEILERYGHFYIRPDSIGYITISVNTIDGVKTKTLHTKSMIATGRLSRFGPKHEGKISKGEFKIQIGLIANLEGYDIDARCKVIEFELIRIDINNKANKHLNISGKFDEIGRNLIAKAETGDIYVFRNIYYKCPGDDYDKRLNDMTFEIK